MTARIEQLYAEIADAYERLGQAQMRDRFLVLAADAALSAGQPAEAEALRRRLLLASPHHLLKPYASFAQAMEAADLVAYVRDLRKIYPAKTADELLVTLRREVADMPIRPVPQAAPVTVFESPSRPAPGPEPSIYKIRDAEEGRGRRATAALPPTLPPGAYVPPRGTVIEEERMPTGSWLAALLFGLVVMGGMLLLGYTLAWPFMSGADVRH